MRASVDGAEGLVYSHLPMCHVLLLTVALSLLGCELPPLELPLPLAGLQVRHDALQRRLEAPEDATCRQQLRLELGRTLVLQGRAAEALGPLTRAVLGPSPDLSARAALELGDAHARLGQPGAAVESYLFAQQRTPGEAASRQAESRAVDLGRFAAPGEQERHYRLDESFDFAVPRSEKGRAFAVAPSGKLGLVTNKSLIERVNEGARPTKISLRDGRSLAFDAADRPWVGTKHGLSVRRSGRSDPSVSERALSNVEGVAVDGRGRVLAISRGQTLLFEELGGTPAELGAAHAAAVLSDGFVLLDKKGRRLFTTPDGETLHVRALRAGLGQPVAVATDRFDRIYVLDTGRREIVILSRSGEVLTRLAGHRFGLTLEHGIALAVDPAGRIYVLHDKGRSIARFR